MKKIATREGGYGKALAKLGTKYPNMVVWMQIYLDLQGLMNL